MMGHSIRFYETISKIIPKLSLLPLFIWSTGSANIVCQLGLDWSIGKSCGTPTAILLRYKFQFTQRNTKHHVFSLKNTPKAFFPPPPPPSSPCRPEIPSHHLPSCRAWHKVPFSDIVALPYSDPPHSSPCRPEIPSHHFPFCRAWHKVPFWDIVALPYSDPSWSTGIYLKVKEYMYNFRGSNSVIVILSGGLHYSKEFAPI